MTTKGRGAMAPNKIQTNWRIRTDVIQGLKDEARSTGFSSIAALINHILYMRYFGNQKGESHGDKS